jgi:hypothetical protein
MDEAAKTSERIAHLDSRVTGLEQGIKDVVSAVRDLSTDFKQDSVRRAEAQLKAQSDARESSKTPWGVIFAGLGVMLAVITAIGGALYAPIHSTQTEIKTELRDVVPRVEHERIWRWQERLGEGFDRRIQKLEEKFDRQQGR